MPSFSRPPLFAPAKPGGRQASSRLFPCQLPSLPRPCCVPPSERINTAPGFGVIAARRFWRMRRGGEAADRSAALGSRTKRKQKCAEAREQIQHVAWDPCVNLLPLEKDGTAAPRAVRSAPFKRSRLGARLGRRAVRALSRRPCRELPTTNSGV